MRKGGEEYRKVRLVPKWSHKEEMQISHKEEPNIPNADQHRTVWREYRINSYKEENSFVQAWL